MNEIDTDVTTCTSRPIHFLRSFSRLLAESFVASGIKKFFCLRQMGRKVDKDPEAKEKLLGDPSIQKEPVDR